MREAGKTFRDRYLSSEGDEKSITTQGISSRELENDQLRILTRGEQYMVASSQAFVQGLYPPIENSPEDGQSSSNSSQFDGYQYPQIISTSRYDADSIWLAGAANCPAFMAFVVEYLESEQAQDRNNDTLPFYERVESQIPDANSTSGIFNYFNSAEVFEYLQYVRAHGERLEGVSQDDLSRARDLADTRVSDLYSGSLDQEPENRKSIQTIAGQTLAGAVVQSLRSNAMTTGSGAKLTLLFGDIESMVSLASLIGFKSSPESKSLGTAGPATSMVFELFSSDADDNEQYPALSDLKIRFLFRSGDDFEAELREHALFENDDDEGDMKLEDFLDQMRSIMISDVIEWCDRCASNSIFCPSLPENDSSEDFDRRLWRDGRGPSRAVSGVIGAVVTFTVAGLVVGCAMLFGGFRIHRQASRKNSPLRAFRGNRKLASDQDVTIAKQGAAPATDHEAAGTQPDAHERVGSWELQNQKGAGAPRISPLDLSNRRESMGRDDDLRVNPFGSPMEPKDQI